MKVGFIGTGSMGSILIEAFLQSGVLKPEQITAGNRSASKLEWLADTYPGINCAHTNAEVVSNSDAIFICVKPAEFLKVIGDIQSVVTERQLVISITSPILVRHLENQLCCKIAKVIPSITNKILSGPTLCIYGDRLEDADIEDLENLLSHISNPIRIDEEHTRIASDISSCGPAFLAYFVQKFIDAAAETGLDRELAVHLAAEMTLGTGKLLTAGGMSPEQLQQRVAVPGGITAEGLRLLEEELADVFTRLVHITHSKYLDDLEKREAQFS